MFVVYLQFWILAKQSICFYAMSHYTRNHVIFVLNYHEVEVKVWDNEQCFEKKKRMFSFFTQTFHLLS